MIYAESGGLRIRAVKGVLARCPSCRASVIAKCGRVKIHHWAHQNIIDCDSWSEGETPWHFEWKEKFPFDWREVVVGPHRADIKTDCGLVVEFQHSPIGLDEIQEREIFYKDMIWVFDAIDFSNRLMFCSYEGIVYFSWKNVRPSHLFISKPLFWDFGNELLSVCGLSSGGGFGKRLTTESFVDGVVRNHELTRKENLIVKSFSSFMDSIRSIPSVSRFKTIVFLTPTSGLESCIDDSEVGELGRMTGYRKQEPAYVNKLKKSIVYRTIDSYLKIYQNAFSFIFPQRYGFVEHFISDGRPIIHVISWNELGNRLLEQLFPDMIVAYDDKQNSVTTIYSKITGK